MPYDSLESLPCFDSGFISALIKAGNDILYYPVSNFASPAWLASNAVREEFDRERIIATVKDFKPNLALAFNNRTIEYLTDITECPIAVIGADSCVYFSAKQAIRENVDRYHFLCMNRQSLQENMSYWKAPKNKYLLFPPATGVSAQQKDEKHPICFIGTNFVQPPVFSKLIEQYPQYASNLKCIIKEVQSDSIAIPHIPESLPIDLYNALGEMELFWKLTFAGEKRLRVLLALSHLGLGLYGMKPDDPYGWNSIYTQFPGLWLCYNHEFVYSLRHNQDIYNSSRIGVSISHTQATTGYPFRIPDIMASNACLVSNSLSEIHADFNVPIPFYESEIEAYEICRKLLAEESWRADLVAASQEAIDRGHRFTHRIKLLEDYFGMNLTNTGKSGQLFIMNSDEFIKSL